MHLGFGFLAEMSLLLALLFGLLALAFSVLAEMSLLLTLLFGLLAFAFSVLAETSLLLALLLGFLLFFFHFLKPASVKVGRQHGYGPPGTVTVGPTILNIPNQFHSTELRPMVSSSSGIPK